jgi:hypothetical protein
MPNLLKLRKDLGDRGDWRPLRECLNQLTFHLLTRIIPSINITYTLPENNFDGTMNWDSIRFCNRAAQCLAHLCSSLFFLDLWRDPFGDPYFVLYGFQFGCTVLCGLVPDCVSRSPQDFGASLPVAWLHPTLIRYKTSYPLFSANYPLSVNLLSCRSEHLLPIHIGTYHHLI